MNELENIDQTQTKAYKELKYSQVEIIPYLKDFNIPTGVVIVIISLIALQKLGLLYFIKDVWAGIKDLFTAKTKQIVELKQQLEALKNRVEVVEMENQELREALATVRPLLAYLELQGASDLGIKQILDKIKKRE